MQTPRAGAENSVLFCSGRNRCHNAAPFILRSVSTVLENLFGKVGTADTPAEPAAKVAASAEETQAWRDKISAASDDAALLVLLHDAPSVPLKLAALEALTQEESMRQALHEVRDQDKRLYRTAKSRWDAAVAKRTTHAEATSLVGTARALLEQPLVPVNRVVELDRAWAALDAQWIEPELAAQFSALSEQLGATVRARGEHAQTVTRWLAAIKGAMQNLNALLPGVANGSLPAADLETLAVNLLEQVQAVPDAADPRCVTETDAANHLLALAASVTQRARFLLTLPAPGVANETEEKHFIEQWRAFPEMSEGELHTVLAERFAGWRNADTRERQHEHETQTAQQRERRAEQYQQRVAAVTKDVDAAEAALAAGHVAELTQALAAIDQSLKRGPVDAGLTQRIETLRREQRRLQDWQRWSGAQGREQLVTEAQQLAEAAKGKVALKAHSEAIAKLRERWKELDKLGGASRQALWLQFDAALEAAYAPVAANLEKQKIARRENLAAREAIITQLNEAAAKFFPAAAEDTPPSTPDWRAVAHALEEAQIAWRKLGPVEHTVPRSALQGEKSISTRYTAALGALQTPLAQTQGEARGKREKLIAAAKELAAGDVSARDVIDKVRKLQSEWQTVAKSAPLQRRDENALWAAFKTATDSIFTARDAARAAREAAVNAQQQARIDIIERVAGLARAGNATDIKRGMSDADAAWRAAPEAPKPQVAKLEARYRAAREAASKRIGELATHAAQARYDALIAAMDLCHERESASDISDEQIAALQSRWAALEHLPPAWQTRMDARFGGEPAAAPAAVKGAKHAPATLPEVLLDLEVACGIDSPAEFLAERQRLKMLALKAAMEARQTVTTSAADIERWMLDAAATPRPNAVSRERLQKIIAAVRRRPGPK